ncbi:MAG: hypothetical protein AAF517_07840, partial [Planctomycetota bacterium]
MKLSTLFALAGALCFAVDATAQPERENDVEEQSPVPLITALDKNGDGQVSFDELENAVAALKSLDMDRNGYLLTRELLGRSREGATQGGQRRFGGGRFGGGRPGGRFGGGRPGGPGGGRRFGGRRGPGGTARAAIMIALDKNNDDEVCVDELKNAVAGLKSLDGDKNESLSRSELIEFRFSQRGGRGGRRGAGRGGQGPSAPTGPLKFEDGTLTIPDRETFAKLSLKAPDAFRFDSDLWNQEVLKFVAVNVGTPDAKVYFQNTKT